MSVSFREPCVAVMLSKILIMVQSSYREAARSQYVVHFVIILG
jgi:Sec-independent protein secretion pathway component TatC